MGRLKLAAGAMALALCLVLPCPVQAKNMNGKLGFGYQQTMLGVRGLSFSYWIAKKVSIDIVAGAGFIIPDSGSNAVTIVAAAGLRYVALGTKHCNLSIGALFDFGWASRFPYTDSADVSQTARNVTQWGVEIPVEVEYFFSDAFSISLATGATFTMLPKLSDKASDEAILGQEGLGYSTGSKDMGIGIGVGSLFGHAGFKFYF